MQLVRIAQSVELLTNSLVLAQTIKGSNPIMDSLMKIKGFSQCIAANKQHACGLAAAASCGMFAAYEFFVCKLVFLLLVAATLRLIVCCNLAACEFFVCKLNFSLLVAACLLQTVAACLEFYA